ncbi:MAG: hypothetical protein H7308_08705 [Chthonomonadaceae bacterium]|nr:hypothetical protein [Chthonomonadaceae bacterium]
MKSLTVIPEEEALPEDLAIILTRAQARNEKSLQHLNKLSNVISWLGFSSLIFAGNFHSIPSFVIIAIIFILGAHFIFSSWMCRKKNGNGLDERDLEQLATINDKRVLKVLLSITFVRSNKTLSLQCEKLLKYWLPLLTSEDTDFLNKQQKNILASGLRTFRDDLTWEVLRVLELIGDGNQSSFLKKWRHNQHDMREKPELERAYTSCVSAIEARAALSLPSTQLLRPSSPTDGADTYLRPVTHKPDEDADTLLRAELGEKEE